MAGEWIPIDITLGSKPEVQELVDLTGQPVEVVVYRLLQLWGWASLNSADGTARATPARLARVCGGDEPFWLSVEAVGWISFDDQSVTISKWGDRFSSAAKARAVDRKRKNTEKSDTFRERLWSGIASKAGKASPTLTAPPGLRPTRRHRSRQNWRRRRSGCGPTRRRRSGQTGESS